MVVLLSIIYDKCNDRIIRTERDFSGNIIGLNFMQGNEIDLFMDPKNGYNNNNDDCLKVYNSLKNNLPENLTELEVVNIAMWTKLSLYDGVNMDSKIDNLAQK